MIPQPSEELPNGRTLVAIRLLARAKPSWAGDLYAVLALTGHVVRRPDPALAGPEPTSKSGTGADAYVVWNFIPEPIDGRDGYCYEGFYTHDFDRAFENFKSRRPPA